MKRSASVTFALLWLLALAPLAAALLAYPHLPAQIPTHWNADGTWMAETAVVSLTEAEDHVCMKLDPIVIEIEDEPQS